MFIVYPYFIMKMHSMYSIFTFILFLLNYQVGFILTASCIKEAGRIQKDGG